MGKAEKTGLREGRGVSWENLDRLCTLLACQPGELLRWDPAEESRGERR